MLWGCRNWCRRMWKRQGPGGQEFHGISAKLATAVWDWGNPQCPSCHLQHQLESSSQWTRSIAGPTALQLVACRSCIVSWYILVQTQLEHIGTNYHRISMDDGLWSDAWSVSSNRREKDPMYSCFSGTRSQTSTIFCIYLKSKTF